MSRRIHLQNMPKNPIAQALSLLFFGVVLIGAVVMGAIVLAFAIALAAVFAVVFWIRMWWLTRKMRRQSSGTSSHERSSSRERSSDSEFIEVEYTVVNERDDSGSRSRRR